MSELFLKSLNMAMAAGWIVPAVLLARFLLKRSPKWIHCLLWGIVALRLVLPFSWQSILSLIPSPQTVPADIANTLTPAIQSGIPALNSVVNPLIAQSPMERLLPVATWLWLAGIVVLLTYGAISAIRLRMQVSAAIPCGQNVYVCDDIGSPFVFGFFRPRIYIPSGLADDHLQYVLDHENAHIRRHDHWWKPLSFLLLSVYWFHPLLWVAYILLCRDIEQACDEKVVSQLDANSKRGYMEALVACSTHRRMILVCPVAFGEVSIKTRIRSILHYKKPTLWIILAAVLTCVIVAVCFLTDPIPCEHQWQAEISAPATCTEPGIRLQTCQLCKEQKSESIPTLSHSYSEGVQTKAPTCQETGICRYTCAECGHQKEEAIIRLTHIAGAPYTVTPANCTNSGQETATCALCQTVYMTAFLPPNHQHDMLETVTRAATCTEPGEGTATCTRCAHTEKRSYTPLAHDYQVGIFTPADCGRDGIKQMICTHCGDCYWLDLHKTGQHQWVDGGYYYPDSCSVCGTWASFGTAEYYGDLSP